MASWLFSKGKALVDKQKAAMGRDDTSTTQAIFGGLRSSMSAVREKANKVFIFVCVHVCMHACMHACMFVRRVGLYVCTYVCMLCMNRCLHSMGVLKLQCRR